MRQLVVILFFLGYFPLVSQASFSPLDPLIRYTGRWSFEQPDAPSASLNGTSLEWAFEGTGSSVTLSTQSKTVYLYVIIDRKEDVYNRQLIEVTDSSPEEFQLAENLESGSHHIQIIQLSEYDSKLVVHGVSVTDGQLTDLPDRKNLKLEFYGDSNTAGWNAWNAFDTGGPEASEAYFSFPGIVSRLLDAEYHLVGVSGSGITNRTWLNLGDKYDLIHVTEEATPANKWNFEANYSNFIPDAVIINLGANDYYAGSPKPIIKQQWKKLISERLRIHYPETHIVLANSYGWAINEPADYVEEAINELIADGDKNVSYVKFPWLWGQEHAVINEHAGFANILAAHLSEMLDVPMQEKSSLSSLVGKSEIYNGGFEKSILPEVADGWRPTGNAKPMASAEAIEGEKLMMISNEGRVRFATEMDPGARIKFLIHGKGVEEISDGIISIQFKDQGQQTIKTAQIRPDFTKEWQEFSVEGSAPQGTWSAWLVLESKGEDAIFFDDARIETLEPLGLEKSTIEVYPNPFSEKVYIQSELSGYSVQVYNCGGQLVAKYQDQEIINTHDWPEGLYYLLVPESDYTWKLLKRTHP